MKIKIAHLYYDILNLYGENGNIKAIEHHLDRLDVDYEIYFLSIDDIIDFKKYDIYYIGCGSNENTLIVLEDILKRKNDIKNAIEENKMFICTGSSIELFGKNIIDINGISHQCLNIFDYYTKEIDLRIVGDEHFKTDLINHNIIGFSNRNKVLLEVSSPLFQVLTGTGNDINDNNEGYTYKNFYGTHLLGPILIRNPFFTDYLLSLITNKTPNIKNDYEYLAYQEKEDEII